MQKFYSINYNLLLDIEREEERLSKDPSNYTTRGTPKACVMSRILNAYAIAIICTYFQKVTEECTFTFSSRLFTKVLGSHDYYGYYDVRKILTSLVNVSYTCMHVKYDYYDLSGAHLRSKNGIRINYDEELIGQSKQWINSNSQLVVQSYGTYQAAYTRGRCKQYQLEGDNVLIGHDFFGSEKLWDKLFKKINRIFGHDILEEKEQIVLNVYRNAKAGLSFTEYYKKHSSKFENGEFQRLLTKLQEQQERAITLSKPKDQLRI